MGLKELEQIAYEAYYAETGGRSMDDKDLPSWAELPEDERRAWRKVVQAITGARTR